MTRLFALLLAAWPGSAAAACTASSSGLNFGQYDPFSPAPLEGVGRINLQCDGPLTVEVGLSQGQGSFAERRLIAGAGALVYNLFIDEQHTTVWGDGAGSTATVTISGSSGIIPIYGIVAPRQNVAPGVYEDMIFVSIVY